MNVVAVTEYGATPELLTAEPRPVGRAEVLIEVQAAGINPMDMTIAAGAWSSQYDAVFPLILGADAAGVVKQVGAEQSRFAVGDRVFGQLLVPPLGSSGTYAEYVVAPASGALAIVPQDLTAAVAAALPTAGGTALGIVEQLGSLTDKTVVVIGAAGGVGSYLTQFAVTAGALVDTVASERDAERLRSYGVTSNYDRSRGSVSEMVRAVHPDGVDVVVDLANKAPSFTDLARTILRSGGTAVTTRYAADADALASVGLTGINFAAAITPDLLTRVGEALVSGRVVAPPITLVALGDVPTLLTAPASRAGGKTVIVFDQE